MTDKSFCEPTLGSTFDYDDMMQYTLVSGAVTTKYAYFIRTWPSNTNVSYTTWTGWGLSYLKCKYFTGVSMQGYFFYGDGEIEVANNQFTSTYCSGTTSGLSPPISKYLS
jgi:hypothetical protein